MELPWDALAPSKRPFDPEQVRPALEAIVAPYAQTFKRADVPRRDIELAIGAAIVDTYGTWAGGWNWAPSEPGGGGPTRGWCCARDSVFREDDPNARATAARALEALIDWRRYLVELETQFAMLRLETAQYELPREIELATVRLLAIVAERTSGEDAWYYTFYCALAWYLQASGLANDKLQVALEHAVRERFESWVTPDEAQGAAAAQAFGQLVGERFGEPSVKRDALAAWRIVRERPIELAPRTYGRVHEDGHELYVVEIDHARDQDRAERMMAALLLARDSARSGMPLTVDQLAEWQRVVLGAAAPVPLRTSDAFAKQGRERYAYSPELREQLEAALAQAGDPSLPVAVRAARAYLDVCFFHPFADGNARAARLALDHVVTSAGMALATGEPVFAIARPAEDDRGVWSLAVVIDRVLGTIADR